MTRPPRRRRGAAWGLRIYRAAIVVATAVALRTAPRTDLIPLGEPPLEIAAVARILPDAEAFAARADGSFTIKNRSGDPIGRLVRTSPASDHVIGFSGPSDVALIFDEDDHIVHVSLVSSGDTRDHVAAVVESSLFWDGILGRTWSEAAVGLPVDAVSGATLTSLAILEGIVARLGGTPTSLRFPDPVAVSEVERFFPTAAAFSGSGPVQAVRDADGVILGHAFRSSPDGDHIVGYQGPTDTLVALDEHGRVLGLQIRSSYETEEYLQYIRNDPSWDTPLRGIALDDLPDVDIDQAEVEGVSGATMTCRAMAESVIIRARAIRDAPQILDARSRSAIQWRPRDAATAIIVLIALWLGFTHRPLPRTRLLLQLAVVVGLGFANGDLVSQAVLAGWARHAIPWRTAAGLTLLVAVALIVPLLTGRNLYCRDLCPHGALQKLARRRFRGRVRMRGSLAKRLASLPAVLLVAVLGLVLFAPAFNLATIEAFDAYVLRHAGIATVVIAVVGLLVSTRVPMAYCRFGCPTGAFLSFLRTSGTHDRLTRRDLVALACVAAAWVFTRT